MLTTFILAFIATSDMARFLSIICFFTILSPRTIGFFIAIDIFLQALVSFNRQWRAKQQNILSLSNKYNRFLNFYNAYVQRIGLYPVISILLQQRFRTSIPKKVEARSAVRLLETNNDVPVGIWDCLNSH